MTGENLADCRDFQQAFWPSEWLFEPQRLVGAMDAPEYLPAGAMERYEGAHITLRVQQAASRGTE